MPKLLGSTRRSCLPVISRKMNRRKSWSTTTIALRETMMKGAIYVSDSGNTKIMGSKKVDATYASIKATCPDSCELKDKGCYAQTSFVGMINNRMNRRAKGDSPLDLAKAEAKAIDESYKGGQVPTGRAMRIHVAGDSRTWAGTRVISNAVLRWKKRG